ncbi:MAG: GH25 family lysozyme [Ignavibacteria bacterium]
MPKLNFLKYFLSLFIITVILSCGDLGFNRPSKESYPVSGIDVSHHQGDIDWDKVSQEDFAFVYIKATEGEEFKDSLYRFNNKNAVRVGFKTGAYHFYLASKDPLKQAENFIKSVPKGSVQLPPVLDIEFPPDMATEKDKSKLIGEIYMCLYKLKNYYGKTPVIYTDYDCYDNYLKPEFKDFDFWIRDIHDTPQFSDRRSWLFWQHSNKGLVNGISGLVDLNVFNGSGKLFDSLYAK